MTTRPPVSLLAQPRRRRQWLWLRRARWWSHWRELTALAAGTLPLQSLLAWFWWRSGTPVAFVHTQLDSWGRSIGMQSIGTELQRIATVRSFEELPLPHLASLLLLPTALGLCVVVQRRLGPGYAAFCSLSLAMAALSGLTGLCGYLAVLFPLFVAAALVLRRREAYGLVLAAFVPGLALCTLSFTHWHLVH